MDCSIRRWSAAWCATTSRPTGSGRRKCASSTGSPNSPWWRPTRPSARRATSGSIPPRPASSSPRAWAGSKPWPPRSACTTRRDADRVSPRLVPMMMANAGAAGISMRLGWRGPSEVICTACAAGTHAIAAAARLVASGRCDVAIGGGSEASMHPVALAAFSNMTALSSSGHSRPFDIRRDGFVMTEGAGALVLEEWDRAVARGATIYAELAGAASTADAHHITAPAPDGSGAVACMELALVDAGIGPSDVGHINAHGTSTPLNDLAEARAIAKVFGDARAARHLHQGGDRSWLGRGRRHRGRRRGAHDRPRHHSSDSRATPSRTPRSRFRSCTGSRARGSRLRSSRIRSASAATTAAWSCCLLAETNR